MPQQPYAMSPPGSGYITYDMSGQPMSTGHYPVSYPSGPIGSPVMVGGVPTGMESYETNALPPAYAVSPTASSIPMHTYTAQTPVDPDNLELENEDLPADYDLESETEGRLPIKPSIGAWISQGWRLYSRHWLAYSLFALLTMILPAAVDILAGEEGHSEEMAPLVLFIYFMWWPLYYGFYIAGSNEYKRVERGIREGITAEVSLDVTDFFRAYLIFLPLIGIITLCGILIFLGFLCFIIPGIYLAVTLSFAPLLYIEYHKQTPSDEARNSDAGNAALLTTSYTLWECVKLSRATAHRHFWHLLGLLVVLFLMTALGSVTVVGALITTPLAALTLVPAVRDLFELQLERAPDRSLYLLCV
eukprot:TRINITY_DN1648_c2_g1_i1.p1 TRINITY_DN1648_c2_g1~~TRINITY_DN1648_c2_g1_i1.p1  ORF type:complete len:416 (-),score=38.84 TRINITY_DN1648_c2_g1_i1:68-1147(-)